MGNLYLVGTPIGNLQDITFRALETLKEVDLILAEDTRRAGVLLKHFEIKKPLSSFHEHNELRREDEIIGILKSGQNVALISDAGTPTLSDPGFKLVRRCYEEKINVFSIPGASAILAALAASGLPTDSFAFLGYFPKKKGKQDKFLEKISILVRDLKITVVFFETPHRILTTLEILDASFPERELALARELTKVNEEKLKGKVPEVFEQVKGRSLKGEMTLVLR
ncbi:MAG: 16S rRNA (cytidine(1402)-2'-O)-methyltransferase [Candidatus Woykebacteria bacterium]